MMRSIRPVFALPPGPAAVITATLFAALPSAADQAERASLTERVYPAHLAAQSLVLDVVKANDRFIAVGQRGHVLISEDGAAWRQSLQVPTRATLNAVTFKDGRLWAVGHDSVIISSADLGETWDLQYSDPDARQPLMDVIFWDADSGIAIGAYSIMMSTGDGGANWLAASINDYLEEAGDEAGDSTGEAAPDDEEDRLEDDDIGGAADINAAAEEFVDDCFDYGECHLNQIVELADGTLLIVAEKGNGYRSFNRGETWQHFRLPYVGSLFGALIESERCLLAFGLRGHVFRSCNNGTDWQAVETGITQNLLGAALSADGARWVIAGSDGALLSGTPGATRVAVRRLPDGEDLAAVLYLDDHLLLAGEDGVKQIPFSAEASQP